MTGWLSVAARQGNLDTLFSSSTGAPCISGCVTLSSYFASQSLKSFIQKMGITEASFHELRRGVNEMCAQYLAPSPAHRNCQINTVIKQCFANGQASLVRRGLSITTSLGDC